MRFFLLLCLSLLSISSVALESRDLFLVVNTDDADETPTYAVVEAILPVQMIDFCYLKYHKKYRATEYQKTDITYVSHGEIGAYKYEKGYQGASYDVFCAVEDLRSSIRELLPVINPEALPKKIVNIGNKGEKLYKIKQFKQWSEPAFKYITLHLISDDLNPSTLNYIPTAGFHDKNTHINVIALEKDHELLGQVILVGEESFTVKYIAKSENFTDATRPVVIARTDGKLKVRTLAEIQDAMGYSL